MPDAKFRSEENVRSPLLNGLIIVTLITVVVALGYLATYYLGAGNERKPTWYAPQMFCRLPHDTCTAQLGRFGTLHFALDGRASAASSRLTFDAAIEGIAARQVEVRLEGRAKYRGTQRIILKPLGEGRFVGEGLQETCTSPVMRWRAQVVAHTEQGLLGSWFDFNMPCPLARVGQ